MKLDPSSVAAIGSSRLPGGAECQFGYAADPKSLRRVDAHQHFWRYSADEYPWIPADSALQRDWLPEDLAAVQAPLGLEGSIAVQARQTLEETRWLLSLADKYPRIHGVVGWVDLRSAELDAQLREFTAHSKFVGVRHVVQDEPDERFMLGAEFLRGLGQLSTLRSATEDGHALGLTYDLLIFPQQLPAAREVVGRFPEQAFVLDHLAKPAVKRRELALVFATFPRLQEREQQIAGTLSGGEQQMLAIGRALMSRPKFLMLDEPSLGIAPLLVKAIFERIVQVNRTQGITMLLVEQNANLALEVSQYGYVLESGSVVLEDPSAELRQDPRVKKAYLGG